MTNYIKIRPNYGNWEQLHFGPITIHIAANGINGKFGDIDIGKLSSYDNASYVYRLPMNAQ